MVDFFKLIKHIGIPLILLVLELRETDATSLAAVAWSNIVER
jgi:hypothetical protein